MVTGAAERHEDARVSDPPFLTAAPRVLDDLAARLGETAHLSVLEGAEVRTIVSSRPTSVVRASGPLGHRVPAHCTSAGRALLFDHDRAMLDRLYGTATLPARGLGAPLDVADLHRRIVAARVHGFAFVDQELEAHLVGVAAPVRDVRGRIVAALNVSAPKFRFGRQLEHVGCLEIRHAAETLSRALGAPHRHAPRAQEES